MPFFDVTISARTTKTYRIEAPDKDEAKEIGNEAFTTKHEPGVEMAFSQDEPMAVLSKDQSQPEPSSLPESAPRMSVSLDGGESFVQADEVLVIQEAVQVPGDDDGEITIRLNRERITTDIWVSREAELDHNIGTETMPMRTLIRRLVEENS